MLALWSIGIIGIAITAYLFMLFAYSSMEEPKDLVYYSRIVKPKASKAKEDSPQEVVLGTLEKK